MVGDRLVFDQYMQMEHVAFQPEGQPVTFERWLLDQLQARRVRVSTHNYAMLAHYVVGYELVATVPLRLAELTCPDSSDHELLEKDGFVVIA